MPDNTLSTLEQIRIKIRRLTRSPSISQITDATIDDYINTFVLYDFPAHLKTFRLRETLTFYTEPYIDTYSGDNIVNNFDNIYTVLYENVYIAGRRASFYQDMGDFFSVYPKTESKVQIGAGDGLPLPVAGTLTSIPVLRNSVSFTSIDVNNAGIQANDDGAGALEGDVLAGGTIDYVTGVYAFTFPVGPAADAPIYSHTVTYEPGLPTAVLYHGNTLTFRQVPDQPYRVEIEVAVRPSELLDDGTMPMPELSQWWQYIAYGGAKKIFEDRMDVESVQKIMPEFKQQEILVNRRTIDQQSKQRTATIYTDVLEDNYNNNMEGR